MTDSRTTLLESLLLDLQEQVTILLDIITALSFLTQIGLHPMVQWKTIEEMKTDETPQFRVWVDGLHHPEKSVTLELEQITDYLKQQAHQHLKDNPMPRTAYPNGMIEWEA